MKEKIKAFWAEWWNQFMKMAEAESRVRSGYWM